MAIILVNYGKGYGIVQGVGMKKELTEAKEEILLHNALDWKKFKILVAVCCSYVVS